MIKKRHIISALGLLLATTGISQTTFNYTGGLQSYTVPADVYTIQVEANGAGGGNGGALNSGVAGKGAFMSGTFDVTPGQELTILVGQRGGDADYVGAGGGGTFIWDTDTDELLIAAGGGGGGGATDGASGNEDGQDASIGNNGTNGSGFSDGAGTSGQGGSTPTAINWAAGGAGWLTDGAIGTDHGCLYECIGGNAILSGTAAGGSGGGSATSSATGGYGGGGGGNARCGAVGGGGGGGYSGGGSGGELVTNEYNGGGGGGSYNSGTDQDNMAGANTENGNLTITEVCNPITLGYSTTDELFGTDGSIDLEVTGGNGGYTFDWDIDEADDFDDDEDLTGLAGGTYTVIVRDASFCDDVTETIVLNSQLGLAENLISTKVYPNPTVDNIQIELKGSFQYTLLTIDGAIISNGNGFDITTVNSSSLARGTYLLKIESNTIVKVITVVKN